MSLGSNEHNHPVNKAAIVAEELEQRMGEKVKKDPSAPVNDAISEVKKEAAEDYKNDLDFLKDVVAELGSKNSAEQRLIRVREEII